VLLHAQSADIAQGGRLPVATRMRGAGDQGIMFGYACRETPEFMPAPLYYSHEILKGISKARHAGAEKTLGPDAKSQVTVRYQNGKPVEATQIGRVPSAFGGVAHIGRRRRPRASIRQGGAARGLDHAKNGFGTSIQPEKFFIGGPDGDSGLTGRKKSSSTPTAARPRTVGGAFFWQGPN